MELFLYVGSEYFGCAGKFVVALGKSVPKFVYILKIRYIRIRINLAGV